MLTSASHAEKNGSPSGPESFSGARTQFASSLRSVRNSIRLLRIADNCIADGLTNGIAECGLIADCGPNCGLRTKAQPGAGDPV
jgi:hypothetical protein